MVSGIIPAQFEKDDSRSEEFKSFLSEVGRRSGDGWKERLKIVALDIRCASPSAYQSLIYSVETVA